MSLIRLIAFTLIGCNISCAQLKSDEFSPYVQSFTLEGDSLIGEGAKLLLGKISESQFVLIGENHNSSQLALLLKTLVPKLASYGFKNLALEVGPESAVKLNQLSDPYDATLNQLKLFNNKYYQNGQYPIVFFGGIEDGQFLREARKYNFNLLGLDQEYSNSYEYLFDELSNIEPLDPALQTAAKLQLREIRASGKDVECRLLRDGVITEYLNSFDDDRSIRIIEALRKSWEIYCLYLEKKYKENNEIRAEYMRSNLLSYFDGNDSIQKTLIKLGHSHTTKDTSPLGIDDIGKLVYSMANEQNLRSMHIAQRQRFVRTFLGFSSDYIKYSRDIEAVLRWGDKHKWVVIDMEKFRAEHSEMPNLSKSMKREIYSYDLILITPLDKRVRPNR